MLSRICTLLQRGVQPKGQQIVFNNILEKTGNHSLSHQTQLLRSAAHAHRTKYAMDKVYMRNLSESEELHINFHYANEQLRVDRDFNFCRKLNEKIGDALVRIRNNIEKELTKKAKKNKKKSPAEVPAPIEGLPEGQIPVEILRSGCDDKITDVTFAELMSGESPQDLRMRIIDRTFEIVFNQPWVVNLVLPTSMLAGFNVYPSKMEMQFADRKHSQGQWFRAKMPASGDLQRGASWEHCGDGFVYTTSNADVGYHLKFVLTPGNEHGSLGPPVEHITKCEVQAGPGSCPFETRHCFTQQRLSGDSIRVVSYNILADLYADSDYTRTHLFPYCPPYALKVDYRKQLYLKEIIGYNADIICLQEVDMKIFDYDLKPVLESQEFGYRGVIAQKGNCGEGVATFYNDRRFELVLTYEMNLGERIPTEPAFASVYEKIKGNEELVKRICDRSTTLQLSLLKSKESKRHLLVANTHLYFHPDADHIRLLQMGFSMLYVDQMYKEISTSLGLDKAGDGGKQLAVIFCGDFNSVPECGIYKLMTEGCVGKDFVDWNSNLEQAVKDVELSQPFSFQSACGTPQYTNYTHAFAACLDYIFYQSDRFAVEQVVPLPTEEELSALTAIPSVVFPSDHVALVADLKFV